MTKEEIIALLEKLKQETVDNPKLGRLGMSDKVMVKRFLNDEDAKDNNPYNVTKGG